MAAEAEHEQIPGPSETIHLPEPSFLPVIVAAGTAIALVGIVFNVVVLVGGLLITTIAIIRWVRETRRDISHLPREH